MPSKGQFGCIKEMTGLVFERLTVISFSHTNGGDAYWNCLCVCGKRKTINGSSMRKGLIRSCGCLHDESASKRNKNNMHNLQHGMSYTRFYKTWTSIRDRCLNPNHDFYAYYGGRGIRIEWKSFEEFKRDMYQSYLLHKKTHSYTSIDRKDNNGNYSKKNCRWATHIEQNNNRRPLPPRKKQHAN